MRVAVSVVGTWSRSTTGANVTLNARVSPFDPTGRLTVQARPPTLPVPAGGVGYAEVRPRATERFWCGEPVRHPFQVQVDVGGDGPLVLDARFDQRPVLPWWLAKALLLALVGLAALVALWLAVLKPAIKDTAAETATSVAREAGAAAGAEAAKPPPGTSPAGVAVGQGRAEPDSVVRGHLWQPGQRAAGP